MTFLCNATWENYSCTSQPSLAMFCCGGITVLHFIAACSYISTSLIYIFYYLCAETKYQNREHGGRNSVIQHKYKKMSEEGIYSMYAHYSQIVQHSGPPPVAWRPVTFWPCLLPLAELSPESPTNTLEQIIQYTKKFCCPLLCQVCTGQGKLTVLHNILDSTLLQCRAFTRSQLLSCFYMVISCLFNSLSTAGMLTEKYTIVL